MQRFEVAGELGGEDLERGRVEKQGWAGTSSRWRLASLVVLHGQDAVDGVLAARLGRGRVPQEPPKCTDSESTVLGAPPLAPPRVAAATGRGSLCVSCRRLVRGDRWPSLSADNVVVELAVEEVASAGGHRALAGRELVPRPLSLSLLLPLLRTLLLVL